MQTKPHAIIIGAGFTGCALAHDLALRGFAVTVLERGEISSGTSGRTHGLLHSGARYCVDDREAAIECIDENIILRNIASQCIEFNGGLFVALNDEDMSYRDAFLEGSADCHIPVEKLSKAETLELEPNLNPNIIEAYTAPDGAFDPLRLAFAFAATAVENSAIFLPYHEVKDLVISGKGNVRGVCVWDKKQNTEFELRGSIVINATGAWAGKVAAMTNANVPVIPTPGVMVAYDQRLTQRVINRLNEPGDGDIIIPQRRMMVIGTTSFEVDDPDYIPIDDEQVEFMNQCAFELIPRLKETKLRGIYMSARPLIGSSIQGRSLSRTFKCYDHKEIDGIGGLVTVTGGKATTCRIMAEKTADLVCSKLGIERVCQTKELVLSSYRNFYRF
ncbi:MAG: FAD-dependent oxidoreductase [Anaerolineaceae bacterium]|nr:FAD-dependent oxidoreductase [Anaerolineaceae bacterium]